MTPDLVIGSAMLASGAAIIVELARSRAGWPALLLGVLVCLAGVRYITASFLPEGWARHGATLLFGVASVGVAAMMYLQVRRTRPEGSRADVPS